MASCIEQVTLGNGTRERKFTTGIRREHPGILDHIESVIHHLVQRICTPAAADNDGVKVLAAQRDFRYVNTVIEVAVVTIRRSGKVCNALTFNEITA